MLHDDWLLSTFPYRALLQGWAEFEHPQSASHSCLTQWTTRPKVEVHNRSLATTLIPSFHAHRCTRSQYATMEAVNHIKLVGTVWFEGASSPGAARRQSSNQKWSGDQSFTFQHFGFCYLRRSSLHFWLSSTDHVLGFCIGCSTNDSASSAPPRQRSCAPSSPQSSSTAPSTPLSRPPSTFWIPMSPSHQRLQLPPWRRSVQ